jgi:hypothetical protein
VSVDIPATPTLAALLRARARQETAQRWLRPVGLVAALLVVARAFRGSPPPGWHGAGLGTMIALRATMVGTVGVLAERRVPQQAQVIFFALFLLGPAALVWLQQGGPGLFGALVAMG